MSAVRDCLFNIFAVNFPYWRPFLHPQPEDALCRGDRDPLVAAAGEEIVTGRRKNLKSWCGLFPVSFFFRGPEIIAVSRPRSYSCYKAAVRTDLVNVNPRSTPRPGSFTIRRPRV